MEIETSDLQVIKKCIVCNYNCKLTVGETKLAKMKNRYWVWILWNFYGNTLVHLLVNVKIQLDWNFCDTASFRSWICFVSLSTLFFLLSIDETSLEFMKLVGNWLYYWKVRFGFSCFGDLEIAYFFTQLLSYES